MNNFIDTFRQEASDLLSDLENALLKLDSGKDDQGLINEVFRVMHTLKGTSAMFGFDNIGKLTHHVENLYDLARDKKIQITEQIVNITLKITDFIKQLLIQPDSQNNDSQVNIFIDQLNKITSELEILITDKETETSKNSNLVTYYIVFRPSEKLLFRGINFLNLFKELCELGKYKIIHHYFEKDDKAKTSGKNLAWGIYLASDCTVKDIENIFMFVIDDCNIIKVADFNIFDNEQIKNIFEEKEVQTGSQSTTKSILEIVEDLQSKTINEIDEPEPEIRFEEEKVSVSNQQGKRINVDSDKLDNLMNLVSDLVTSNAILSMATKTKNLQMLDNIAEKFERLTRQFRDVALGVRLVSIKELLLRFKRLIRDLSKELGKEVQFIVEGEETEMDKNIIDNLSDPLMHILRNALDHGIESPEERKKMNKSNTGTIKLAAFYSGAYVYITIQDDGAGIDHEKIKKHAINKGFISKSDNLSRKEIYGLLFKPGFSTAKKITDVSGRGVGLDVVKSRITELQGEVEIDSEIGLGSTFTIKLQQSISIIDTLLVRSASTLYLIPQSNILFCIQDKYDQLYKNLNKRIVHENTIIPYINLREVFKNKKESPDKAKLVVVSKNNFQFAIVADEIIGEHQAVIKPLGSIIKNQEYFTGVSLLGDGSLAFMIDLSHLQEYATENIIAKAV